MNASTSVTTAFVVIGLIYIAQHQTIQKIMAWAREGAGTGGTGIPSNPEPNQPSGPTIPSGGVQCTSPNGSHYFSQSGVC